MTNKKSYININTNAYILNSLKKYFNTDSLCDSELANIINWKHKDILKLESAEQELRPKELKLISKHLGISVNNLFPEVKINPHFERLIATSKVKKHNSK